MSDAIHVLLIDGDPLDAARTRALLEGADRSFKVETKTALKEGKAHLAQDHVDIIVTGLGLPDARGLTCVDALVQAAGKVPVMVVTGLDDRAVGLEAMRRGAQDYLIRDRVPGTSLSRILRYAIERKRAEQALHEAHRKLHTLIDNLPGVFYRCGNDPARTMEYLSQGVLELTGFEADDLVANRTLAYSSLIHEDDRGTVGAAVREALAARRAYTLEYRIRSSTGDTKWVWERGTGVFVGGRLEALEGFLTDITERRRTDEALREAEERYRSVVDEISDGICICDAPGVLTFANPALARIVGEDRPQDLLGRRVDEFVLAGAMDGLREKMRAAFRNGEGDAPMIATVPIRKKDGSVGIVEVRAARVRCVGGTRQVSAVVRDITRDVQASQAQKDSHRQTRKALEGTILAMSRTVETRDPYTAGHQRRVADLARAVAQAMSLEDHRVEGLYLAGLVHDVGKIGLPAEILSKPGRLTATEFQLIQSHPVLGAEIIGDIDFPWPIARMVREHHERMDGSGYPDRLPGDRILLESRILAVADVVEAMVSDRPYRPGLGIEAALSETESGAGRLYDADAAGACIRLIRDRNWRFV